MPWQKWSSQNGSALADILQLLSTVAIDSAWDEAVAKAGLAASHTSKPAVRQLLTRMRTENWAATAPAGMRRAAECHLPRVSAFCTEEGDLGSMLRRVADEVDTDTGFLLMVVIKSAASTGNML